MMARVRRRGRPRLPLLGFCVLLAAVTFPANAAAPVGQAEPAVSREALLEAIGHLGDLDFTSRMTASRTVRRAERNMAVPALIEAVSSHADGYVRFRALVLLSGFNDPRARDVMLDAMADANDRLREVAYAYFEANPEPGLATTLLERLDRELSEFVRPRLVRALAAHGDDARVQEALKREALSGEDFFRSAVIEALGEHGALYALPQLVEVVGLDGPLRDDAALALGRLGDPRVLPTLAELQRVVPREEQPALAAAICLLGVNCASHRRFLIKTLAFAIDHVGFQDLVRAAASSLAALAARGDREALAALIDAGIPARDPYRSPIALALGAVVLKDPALSLETVEAAADPAGVVELMRDAFDMLEEDFAEERFFVTIRAAYWQAPEGSPRRAAVERLVRELEF